MVVYANVQPASAYDGDLYSSAVPLTSTEADLSNQSVPYNFDPRPVKYGEAALATILFTASGPIASQSCYVVMQTDMGDGQWIDVAWCVWSGISGTALFALSAGVAGANSIQQTRAVGTAPSSNGSNQICLGGRVRFVGKTTLGQSSSSPSGSIAQVTATIRLKLLGLR